ncbi:Hpt domain-containing protein [Flavobacterium sp.]|uniref:Hpt domain-containing protein n=1 Tax=Flavobacterium sp. TaxID=239 RepID=UPI002489A593|nr:Hpt domain-containing protein [Flavobacterium sp.]MDI1317740.1 Hpt domain-containing protein [Flavobacterium sp.]
MLAQNSFLRFTNKTIDEQPNLEYIDKLADGDEVIRERLISVLKQEFPEEFALYRKHILNSNYRQAAESVHKIRHKIGLLGLEIRYYSSKI